MRDKAVEGRDAKRLGISFADAPELFPESLSGLVHRRIWFVHVDPNEWDALGAGERTLLVLHNFSRVVFDFGQIPERLEKPGHRLHAVVDIQAVAINGFGDEGRLHMGRDFDPGFRLPAMIGQTVVEVDERIEGKFFQCLGARKFVLLQIFLEHLFGNRTLAGAVVFVAEKVEGDAREAGPRYIMPSFFLMYLVCRCPH